MLKSLEVKDYALIEHINVEFGKGLNIITGETGAGKSILIDAMSLLLGERASADVVRKDSSKAFVEGIFDVENNKKVKTYFQENELEFSPELIMRREISLKGSNRAFINDSPVSLSVFKELGNLLVDLHGQHEHQSLLRTETHIDYLDEYADLDEKLANYKSQYLEYQKLVKELNELKEQENTIKEKKDFYDFQLKEINKINPVENEDTELESDLKIMENSEKLLELTENASGFLEDSESSVYESLSKVNNILKDLARIDKEFDEYQASCSGVISSIKEITSFLNSYKYKIDVDPQKLEENRSRLLTLNMLKKKYGGTLSAVIYYRDKISEEYDKAENFSDIIIKLENELSEKFNICSELAQELSSIRKEKAKKAEKEIVKNLISLGIEKAEFQVKFKAKEKLTSKGFDEVEFFIALNSGEDTKPLAKTASGGEISRIMLSLKTILANSDKLPLLIFDEIDTGVSGRIAGKIGKALKELSKFHQVISITHLPQIAACAAFHYNVEKTIEKNRVSSLIRKLNDEERTIEIAKLLSGEFVTENGLSSAREMLSSS